MQQGAAVQQRDRVQLQLYPSSCSQHMHGSVCPSMNMQDLLLEVSLHVIGRSCALRTVHDTFANADQQAAT
jgi:hypothetical protein